MFILIDLPLYRGKELSGKNYIIGYLKQCTKDLSYQIQDYQNIDNYYDIDPSTLSIFIVGNLDSNKNKIFASLDIVNGIGGDIIEYEDPNNFKLKESVVWIDPEGLNVEGLDLCSIRYSSTIKSIKTS